MQIPSNLLRFFEQHFSEALSYGLEVKRPDPETGTLRSWRKEQSWSGEENLDDPDACAERVVEAAVGFLEAAGDYPYRAFIRVPKEVSSDGRVRCEFKVPRHSNPNTPTIPVPVGKLMPELDERNVALLHFVLGIEATNSARLESQLGIERERLNDEREHQKGLIGAVTGMVQETRDDRIAFLQEMREERKNHRETVGPILTHAAQALSNAAELVKVHQENNTQVQLAKLQYEAEKESREQWWGLLAQAPLAAKFLQQMRAKKKRKNQLPGGETPEDEMPTNGPAAKLLSILEPLTESQLEDARRLIGAKHFNALYGAAGVDDEQTRSALQAFLIAQATAMLKDPEGSEAKKQELAALLGEESSAAFVALLMDDDEPDDDEPGDEPEPEPATVTDLVQPNGFVRALRDLGWHELTDAQTLKIGEQLGARLTGVLAGAAAGFDEHKAHVALLTLSSRMSELVEEKSQEEAEKRFEILEEALGDTGDTLANLLHRAISAAPPEPKE